MKLIPDWRSAWRYFSVQAAAAAVILGTMPVETQAAIMALFGVGPERLPAALGLLALVGRLLDQTQARDRAA